MAASLRRRARLRLSDRPSLAIERLGYQLVEEYLGRGVYGHTERGTRIIRLAPIYYPPKREFVAAHELLEQALPSSLSGAARERACQRGAAALLLPARAFIRTLWLLAWDLPALVRLWRWASPEAIGFRIADVYQWASFAVWADSRFRRSGGGSPTPLEREAYARAAVKGWARLESDGQAVTAWRLLEPGVRLKVAAVSVG